jgi:hypothetical protein
VRAGVYLCANSHITSVAANGFCVSWRFFIVMARCHDDDVDNDLAPEACLVATPNLAVLSEN